ncbi:DUF2461 family protein [Nonomuraea longispora]|uniref:DUF2461 family protein n=1 Tax=Nonomuraea longispora TaxID=1848320 RepID=A0A4R4NLI2_9ACTN|nr:DUF2461 family protein [Nonomuraea longispora]
MASRWRRGHERGLSLPRPGAVDGYASTEPAHRPGGNLNQRERGIQVTAFAGWSPELATFFTGLEQDNSPGYLDARRDLYRRAVLEPTRTLAAELEHKYGKAHIFRLRKDARFADGRHPYHTHLGVQFAGNGTHHYLSVSARELIASVGVVRARGVWLSRFRAAAAGPAGARLLTIISALEAEGFTVSGETLKKAPRGHPQSHPHIALLRRTGLAATWRWPASLWLGNPGAAGLITGAWERAAPLSGWLRRFAPLED